MLKTKKMSGQLNSIYTALPHLNLKNIFLPQLQYQLQHLKNIHLHIPQDQKKTLSMPIDLTPKKIAGIFDDKYIEYKSGSDENLTIKKYLENIKPYNRIIKHLLNVI